MNEKPISPESAGYVLGVTRQTIHNMLTDGRLDAPLTVKSVLAFIEAQRANLDKAEQRLTLVQS
jgi:hypothetical protein